MHSPRRQRRNDALLRRGSNGRTQRLPGTTHAALAGHALTAPPKTRRRCSAPRLQRRDATTTRYCERGAGRSCNRRAAKDATTPLCAAATTGGALRLPGTAHAAPADHALAAPPKTRRRRSAPRLQRREATTTRHCSRGAGRSCTCRAAKDATTPLCAAAPTARCYDYPTLLKRRWKVMHLPRHQRRNKPSSGVTVAWRPGSSNAETDT